MWFRRDLRLHDNAALYHSLRTGMPVVPIFIFDKYILDDLEDKDDQRVSFIYLALEKMQEQLLKLESTLEVYYGHPEDVFKSILKTYEVECVYANNDYEQYAIDRDDAIAALLKTNGAEFKPYKDQVVFEKGEVLKDDGTAYTVFTPYSRKWKATLNDFYLKEYPTEKYFSNLYKQEENKFPSLNEMGFKETKEKFPSAEFKKDLIKNYTETRNFPGINGTSRYGVHLRFGTISARQLTARVKGLNETFLNELIWREFYQMILWNFDHVRKGSSFKLEFDKLQWRNNNEEFDVWTKGKTGYPIVDAGMRQLNATGFMHNRVRMITASFLTKHLLIDWRWGEAYFAKKLLDYDFASNVGGWQWASGSGVDAAPYFRIFNPTLQAKKFDPELRYIKKWVEEINSFDYPQPMIDHEFARKRALEFFKKGFN